MFMGTRPVRVIMLVLVSWLVVAVSACPAPPPGSTGPRGGRSSIAPDSCGTINTTKVGRKLYAFLVASAELDRASYELERSVHDACKKMAVELGVSPAGSIKEVCTRAATELDANLEVSVRTEQRLVTRYTPPVCETNIDVTAGFVAECEASVAADVAVSCQGRCGGTCNGACDGTCATMGGGGQCAGNCAGTCRGRCTGGCDGYVDVDASAECEASAEIRASVRTECSEPKVEVVKQDVTVVDDTKFQAAMRAIEVGMPKILRAGKKLELAGKALVAWVDTGGRLVAAAGELGQDLGDKAICVGAQLAAVVAATADIQARFSVSIEVSAQVSASAGATAQ